MPEHPSAQNILESICDLVAHVTFAGTLDPAGQITFHWYRGGLAEMPLHVPLPLLEMVTAWMDDAGVEALRNVIGRALQGQPVHFDYQAPLFPGGSMNWFQCRATSTPWPEGGEGTVYFRGAIIDIHSEKRYQLELQQQQQELQTIFDAMQESVIYLDREGRFLRQNEFARRYSGNSADQQQGLTAPDIVPYWDDPARRHAETLDVVRSGQPRLQSLESFTRDGETHWVRVDKVPTRDTAGQVTGVLLFIRDVTAQHRAEQELEQRNRFIERVSTLTPNLLYVFDLEQLKPVYMNSHALQFLGYENFAATDTFSLAAIMHPDDLALFPEHISRMQQASDGEVLEFNYRLRVADGTWRWMLSRDMPFERHADGRARLTIGTSIDITSLKNSEAALRNMVLRNEALLRTIPDLMFLLDVHGTFTDFHSPDAAQLAMPPEAFLGRKVDEVLPAELAEQWRQASAAALADGTVHSFEYTLAIRGSMRWFEARVVRCEQEQVLVIARDVTDLHHAHAALQKSEVTYRRLVETSRDLIWSVDRDGRWTFLNRDASVRILGYEPEELLGQPFSDLQTPERAATDLQTFAKLLQGEAVFGYHTEHRHRSGAIKQLQYNAIPLRDAQGEIMGTTGTATDVTEQLAIAERLKEQQTELAHVSRLSTLGQMVAVIAHEITQPLAAIANYAAVCENLTVAHPGLPVDLKMCLATISAQAQRAGEIIQQLRTYSRRTQQYRALHDVNVVVRDSAALTALDSSQQASITFELAEQLPRVFVDRVQLQQVLVNLLKNANEAGEMAGVEHNRVLVRTWLAERTVVIEVLDSGQGVTHAGMGRLFQPFFTTKPQGLGMGLAICRTIVESHSGTIEASNLPGGGACFRVQLPVGE